MKGYKMKMTEIRQKAAKIGLKGQFLKKTDLIRAIQAAEGNKACFSTGQEKCDQFACCWREDCMPKQK